MIVRTIRLLNYYVVAALLLSSIVPVQAQTVRQRALRTGQAVRNLGAATVGGVRYGVDWVNRQIESVRLPVWAKRRIAATFKRFATPTEQEQAVIEKYITGQRLNVAERQIWNQYKSRVYKSRGAIAVIVTVVLAILATIGGAVYLSRRDGDGAPIPIGPSSGARQVGGAGAPADTKDAQGRIIRLGDIVSFQSSLHGRRNWQVVAIANDNYFTLQATDDSAIVQDRVDPRLTTIVTEPSTLWEAPLEEAGHEEAVAAEAATIPLPAQTLEEQAELAELIESPRQTIERLRQKREKEGLNWAEQLMLEHSERQVAEAGAAGRRRPSRRVVEQEGITITRVPIEQAAAAYTQPTRVEEFQAPEELTRGYLDIGEEFDQLARNQALQQASARDAEQYQAAMEQWGNRWQAMKRAGYLIDDERAVYGVFALLLNKLDNYTRQQVALRFRALSPKDQRFLQEFIKIDIPLKGKLQRILDAHQRLQAGEAQRAAILEGAAAEQTDPDTGIMRSLVYSMSGRKGAAARSAAGKEEAEAPAAQQSGLLSRLGSLIGWGAAEEAVPAAQQRPLVTEWGRLKVALDRYLREARENIIAGRATAFNNMDQLQRFIARASREQLDLATRQRIVADLEGFIGSGKALQSLMTDIMRTGGGEEITPDSLEAVARANFSRIPDVFNLSPENVYQFLGVPMSTPADNMRAIISAKIAALEREGYQKEDLEWLQRQLMYYTNPYEKDRLDAYLGDNEALQRLQEQAAVRLSDEARGAQEDTVMQLIELLQRIQSQLQRS